eukprot:42403-Pleurochrysis_carterae.AAC.1
MDEGQARRRLEGVRGESERRGWWFRRAEDLPRRERRRLRRSAASTRGGTRRRSAQHERKCEERSGCRSRVSIGTRRHVSAVSSLRSESGHAWARRFVRQQDERDQERQESERQRAVVWPEK